MQKRKLVSSDSYVIRLAGIVTDYDHLVLTRLYQPILGQTALSLYFTMVSEVKFNFLSDIFSHQKLFEITQTDINSFERDCKLLEAIGLLKTYISTTSKGENEFYYYDLYSPLDAASFLSHPLYGLLLKQRVSEETYNSLVSYFKMNNEVEGYKKDISASFKSVYKVNLDDPSANTLLKDMGVTVKNNTTTSSSFDLSKLNIMLKNHNIKQEVLNEEVVNELDKAASLYGLNEEQLVRIMEDCVISNGLHQVLNIDKFRNHCFTNNKINDNTVMSLSEKENKLIAFFTDNTAEDILEYSQNGLKPTTSDKELINEIRNETALPDQVIGVILSFVLKEKNKSLPRKYTLTIASDLMRHEITTAKEAIDYLNNRNKQISDKKDSKDARFNTVQMKLINETEIKTNKDVIDPSIEEEIARLRAERKAKKAKKS